MTTRRVPGLVWLRLHVGRHVEPQWRVSGPEYYHGVVRRLAWSIRGWGFAVMWMPRRDQQ